jgi:TorA maturation chaperone TorD
MAELGLSASEQARARSRVYGIVARLLLSGLDVGTVAQLRALDGWLLDGLVDGASEPDLDEIAAEHHACFHLGVFPYAGAFLDPCAEAGAWSERVRGYYERAGFRPRLHEHTADHLGVELVFASFVSGAVGEALEDGRPQLAASLEELLAEFFDVCVLSWLPALVVASASLEGEFWPRVLGEVLELCAEHRARLARPVGPAPRLGREQALLADARTGLRQIAEHLLTPAHSGVCLTRTDIARLGRGRELPRGFGSRLIMLDNLLRSAVDYDQLPALLEDVDTLLRARVSALGELGARLGLELTLAPWLATLECSRELVQTVGASASAATPWQGPPEWKSKPSTTTPPAR